MGLLVPATIAMLSWFTPDAAARDACEYYRENMPQIYILFCKGDRRPRPAGATSAFADGFNISSGAKLPTAPTSYGLETIGSYLRNNTPSLAPTFSLIKGYKKVGTGVSTSGNGTFYGNDIVQRAKGPSDLGSFKPAERARSSLPNVNAGTSFALYSSRNLGMNLGLSARFNRITNTFGGGVGAAVSPGDFTVGVGLTREKVSNALGPTWFGSAFLAYRLPFIEFEYMFLENAGGYDLLPVHVVTATLDIGHVMLTAAIRRLNYFHEGTVVQKHFAIQLLLSRNFAIGALYNFIPGANSLALQTYL